MTNKEKLKLTALEYAEKNNIVNQKTINAFIDGFNLRDSGNAELNLTQIQKEFKSNYNSWEIDCGYSDLRNDQYQSRKLEGNQAKEIANDIESLILKINQFNTEHQRKY